MFSKMRAATGLLTLSSMLGSAQASPLNALEARQQCVASGYGGTVVYISTNVISYPVIINQYYESNTNIIINGGVTININNAPTYLDTTVTVTTTTTSTSTQSITTTTTAPPAPTGATFVIAVIAGVLNKEKSKRQSGGFLSFIGGTATVVADKGSASLFSISSGFLFSEGSFIGVSNDALTTGFEAFQLSSTQPDIAQTWSFAIGGAVTFANGAFAFGGFAEFCEDVNNIAYIEATGPPSFECLSIELVAESPIPSSTSSSSSTTTSDTSADLSVADPTGLPRARSMVKKASMNGAVRRGGFYRSPNKA